MRKIFERFNDIGLRSKVIFSFITLIFIPFLVISLIIVDNFREIMIEKSFKQSIENLEESKIRTLESLSKALRISDKIYVMDELSEMVNREYQSSAEVFTAFYNFKTFQNLVADSDEITGIKLYVDNSSMLNNWEFIPITPEITKRFWYREGITAAGRNVWLSFSDKTRDKKSKLSVTRQLPIGILVIDIDTERLATTFPEGAFETYIVDANGTIISSNRDKVGLHYRDVSKNLPSLESSDGEYDVWIDDEKYKLLISDVLPENSVNGIKIYSLFSISSINKEANEVWLSSIKYMVIIFLIALYALYLMNTLFVKRLIRVQTSIDRVSKGDLTSLIEIDGTDEIGRLAIQFNKMVTNINKLLKEIEENNNQKIEMEKYQNEIKLQMLASQINPHFLFNSLETIRMKAHIDNQPEIAKVVKQLGRLLRRILDIDGRWMTLYDELQIIKSFLEIEKFRLDDNLEYSIEVDEGCMDIMIPPLLLQPLVENALVHGIEKKAGGGTLTILVERVKKGISITVRDNGSGVDLKVIEKILHGNQFTRTAHIGIKNVNERLKLSYGEESILQFRTPSDGGLEINFLIPLEVKGD